MSADQKALLEAIEAKLKEGVEQYHGELKEFGEVSKATAADVKKLAEDHASLVKSGEEVDSRLQGIEQKIADGFGSGDPADYKSWGQSFIESDSFKAFTEGGDSMKARIEVKNTILGEAGSPLEPSNVLVPEQRLPGIVPGAFRALNILDFVPTGVTGANQIEYTREASWTNNAGETSEGEQKPESALTFELINDPVRTIAHFIKASKQVLDDAPMLSSYIDRRMVHGLRSRLQSQILKGNGTTPNISGVNQTGRHTAFSPATGDLALDSLNKAKYAIIGADYSPRS
jgi:HK97 family phage major capsid protein